MIRGVDKMPKTIDLIEVSLISTGEGRPSPERLEQLRRHHEAVMAPTKEPSPLIGGSPEYWPKKYRK